MPDISMCGNRTCPSRMKCYRYRARPDEHWQSWMEFQVPDCLDRCGSFMELWAFQHVNPDRLTPESELP